MITPGVMRQAVSTLQQPSQRAYPPSPIRQQGGGDLPAPQRAYPPGPIRARVGGSLPAPQLPAPQRTMSVGAAPRQQTAPAAATSLGDLMPPIAPVRDAAIAPPPPLQTMTAAPVEQAPMAMGMRQMRGGPWGG